jgi:hypothetical protein
MKADGTGRSQVVSEPVDFLVNISPDEKWAVVWTALPSQVQPGTLAFPIGGGKPRVVCACASGPRYQTSPVVSWSRDGKSMLIALVSMGPARTVVIPTAPGSALPDVPESQMLTPTEVAKLPGAAIISETSVAPGTSAVYAFARVSAQQNLYRIYLPE